MDHENNFKEEVLQLLKQNDIPGRNWVQCSAEQLETSFSSLENIVTNLFVTGKENLSKSRSEFSIYRYKYIFIN